MHIADVAALYALVLAKAPAGQFMYVENAEESLGEITRSIAARLNLGPAESLAAQPAITMWGRELAVFALGSNSQVRGQFARDQLGWAPAHQSIIDWIRYE